MVVTVMRLALYGVKTAVSSLTRHICQLNITGSGIQAVRSSEESYHTLEKLKCYGIA